MIKPRLPVPAVCLSALSLIGGIANIQSAALALPPLVVPVQGQPSVAFDRIRYTPATIRLSFSTDSRAGSEEDRAFLDLSLIAPQGDLVGKRVSVSTREFSSLLRSLYGDLARQAPLDVSNPKSASRRLYDLLIRPLLPELQAGGVTTLLISADSGLQAVPFAALHDGERYFGEAMAFSITPSIGLMSLDIPQGGAKRELALGSSRFEGLAPLPLVPQEVEEVTTLSGGQQFLDEAFTPEVLLANVANPAIDRVHVATHAEFLPGGPAKARLYSGKGPVSLAAFSTMRQRREGQPLDLFILSACRTALGDKDSELGFAGLALQAGARSAIGTLWYVDDVATSAFFVQFYRYLQAGLPKAEALQATRRLFVSGAVRLDGDRLLGPDGKLLLRGLSMAQQRRVAEGLAHPYFWAGIQLMGTPW
jgi:CHAT domain-containing protein